MSLADRAQSRPPSGACRPPPPSPDPELAEAFYDEVLTCEAPLELGFMPAGEPHLITAMTSVTLADPTDDDRLRKQLREALHEYHPRRWNVYFGANGPVGPGFAECFRRNKDLDREVPFARRYFSELRPRLDRPLAQARAEMAWRLQQKFYGYGPPTIVDTGWSMWAFWNLKEPIRLRTEFPMKFDLRRQNYSCHQASLMFCDQENHWDLSNALCPLPGSVFWPSPSMAARGVVPTLVRYGLDGEAPI